MVVELRRGEPSDAAALGAICYRAFRDIAEAHGFLPDFPSPQAAAGVIGWMIAHPGCFDVVAQVDGAVVGSNFMDERNPIAGIGPITVDPLAQNSGAGRVLMGEVLRRARERGFAGVRLVQAGYHCRSLALYLALGFEVREQLACLQGPALGQVTPGCAVRAATPVDLEACNQFCLRIHGHERGGELADAIAGGGASVVERAGRITGYATAIGFTGHAVGETNEDLQALIGAAPAFGGSGFLVPTRNGALLRWALGAGLRITQTLTLMTIGLYNPPAGAWLPSILY
jgi:GNAT superfamily N-acetyltransferase